MSRIVDHLHAKELRSAWHIRSASFDQKIADPEIRAFLAKESWSDDNFTLQKKGLTRCLDLADELGLKWSYDWVLSRDAYDFTAEPVFQYLVLCSLIGMQRDLPQNTDTQILSSISARQTDGWVLNDWRAQPVGADAGIGWVQIPFAWDDFLKTAIDGWLVAAGVDRQQPLLEICEQIAHKRSPDLDLTAAAPIWRSLAARSIAGSHGLKVRHIYESAWISYLCQRHSLLTTDVLHQRTFPTPDTGLTLAHAAMAYTVAHETAHILQERCNRPFSIDSQGAMARERDADLMAMGALWNCQWALCSEERPGQSFQQLWFASGLFFHIGLVMNTCVQRPIDKYVLKCEEKALSRLACAKDRLSTWGDIACRLAESLAKGGNGSAATDCQRILSLLQSLVAYSNALLDFCEKTVSEGIEEARSLHNAFMHSTNN